MKRKFIPKAHESEFALQGIEKDILMAPPGHAASSALHCLMTLDHRSAIPCVPEQVNTFG